MDKKEEETGRYIVSFRGKLLVIENKHFIYNTYEKASLMRKTIIKIAYETQPEGQDYDALFSIRPETVKYTRYNDKWLTDEELQTEVFKNHDKFMIQYLADEFIKTIL